ncbi:MAG: hypothetical protein EOO13_06825 [Chitinophagaceae bacterium]|nr:MAG: hypothetical protein EOO13_06825 [Chitinophagaceae bacterium]
MKKILLVFFCIFFFGKSYATVGHNDTIYWYAGSQLDFLDFRALPDTASANDAISSITIDYEYSQIMSSKQIVRVSVFCYFNKQQSWIKKKDSSLLNHEQEHFNLAELYTRKFRKKISEYFTQNKTGSFEAIQKLYFDIRAAYEAQAMLYDAATEHSKNKKLQVEWNEKIRQKG